ncbi:protein ACCUMULATION AND REPLICATION OF CHLOROPLASTS 3, chloroplastic isoform X1 [Primulina tabacum]|uniref:protein ACCUMULATION AND REPLICATION OF CHLOROPLASTS 3, chloroplastic isoform X1 n=2 Tax=Primulina tabacum TaxID=48773 RepID=UPI003F590BC2
MSEESCECVEVIVVGSRKDAMLDFCSGSPLVSPVLRFWNVVVNDSEQAQLQQRFTKQDRTPRMVEDFSERQSSSKAFILVASAAYGSEHIIALNVLSNIKAGNGLVVGIILKPFSFEGRRRQNEVNELVGRIQMQSNFSIVLDTDTLLENDLVTLDEALRTSNNTVLMAMNAISIIISERCVKLLNKKDNSIREIQFLEFRKIVERYNKARIGFGAGYNVRTSLLRSTNDCPFLGVDLKDIDGVILCIFASSDVTDCGDATTIFQTVRQTIGWNSEMIVSIVHESSLEPSVILTTVIAFGESKQRLAPKKGIFSDLGRHFPFIFDTFRKKFQQCISTEEAYLSKNSDDSDMVNSSVHDIFYANSTDGAPETDANSSKNQPLFHNSELSFSSFNSGDQDLEFWQANSNSSIHDPYAEAPKMFKRELFTRGNFGPGHSTDLSMYNDSSSESSDSVSIYKLPVGVKQLEKSEDTLFTSNTENGADGKVGDSKKKQPQASLLSLSESMEAADYSLADFNHNTSVLKRRKFTSNSEKQGVLSTRAASMLESERDSEKKWNRVVEMKYRGGIYKGRTQGGLPEGKGRLLLGDGSIYDGMWRYGKRSGLGTFCFNNGDVFQGSWRDDVMHGKGWFYFHTGDRWFVNFWKGKANGEGRFYSKLGDVFFGQFKEGWRHGHFLHINVDGTRSREVWDEGVLVSNELLDAEAEDS